MPKKSKCLSTVKQPKNAPFSPTESAGVFHGSDDEIKNSRQTTVRC